MNQVTITTKQYDVTINGAKLQSTVVQQQLKVATIAQGPQGLPGTALLVIGETPAGLMNGSNVTFTAAFDFVPESVAVFVNGLFQQRIMEFQTSGVRTILLVTPPASIEVLRVNYTRV